MPSPVLAERTANALIEDAEGHFPRGLPHAAAIERAVDASKRRYGGLWVGGKARLTAEELTFTPNSVNRAAHSSGTLDLAVPLVAVDAVTVERGFVTKIIVLAVGPSVLKVRCTGADAFAEQIRAAAHAARHGG